MRTSCWMASETRRLGRLEWDSVQVKCASGKMRPLSFLRQMAMRFGADEGPCRGWGEEAFALAAEQRGVSGATHTTRLGKPRDLHAFPPTLRQRLSPFACSCLLLAFVPYAGSPERMRELSVSNPWLTLSILSFSQWVSSLVGSRWDGTDLTILKRCLRCALLPAVISRRLEPLG